MKKYYDLDFNAEEVDARLQQVSINETNINNNTIAIENLQEAINIHEIVAVLDGLINLWNDIVINNEN